MHDSTMAGAFTMDACAVGISIMNSVRAATTSPLCRQADSPGELPLIDGLQLSVGDDILVKDEPNAMQNGIYSVLDLGSQERSFVLARTDELSAGTEITQAFTFGEGGDRNGSRGFVTSTTPARVGIDAVEFSLFGPELVQVQDKEELVEEVKDDA